MQLIFQFNKMYLDTIKQLFLFGIPKILLFSTNTYKFFLKEVSFVNTTKFVKWLAKAGGRTVGYP